MYNILMVCMGNLCRSPLAEAALRSLLARRGLERRFKVDSAGTHAHRHAGQRPDPRAMQVASRRGYVGMDKLRARGMVETDFRKFDIVVAMDTENLLHLRAICPTVSQQKLHLLMEFVSDSDNINVPDPYYGSLEGFEKVLDLCEAGVSGLLDACCRQPSSTQMR